MAGGNVLNPVCQLTLGYLVKQVLTRGRLNGDTKEGCHHICCETTRVTTRQKSWICMKTYIWGIHYVCRWVWCEIPSISKWLIRNLTTHIFIIPGLQYIPRNMHTVFCFAVLCCGYTLTDFPISIRLTSLALWQSNDCPSASKVTLMNMDKYFMWIHYQRLHNHNKAKHNKTVCIFLGIYCTWRLPSDGVFYSVLFCGSIASGHWLRWLDNTDPFIQNGYSPFSSNFYASQAYHFFYNILLQS